MKTFFYGNRNAIFKVVLFVLLLGFIVHRLCWAGDIRKQYELLMHTRGDWRWLMAVVVLMPLNWLTEALKWQLLRRERGAASFTEALYEVLAGVASGFVTPGRAGEFIGRAYFSTTAQKQSLFWLSTLGGIAQASITFMAGALALGMVFQEPFIQGLAIGLGAVFTLLFFRFDLIGKGLHILPEAVLKRVVFPEDALPRQTVLLCVFLLSAMRYVIYLVQYAAVFQFFAGDQFFLMMLYSAILLAVQALSPFMPWADISFRGSAALFIFGSQPFAALSVVTGVTLIWFLNLVLPAITGYLLILRNK